MLHAAALSALLATAAAAASESGSGVDSLTGNLILIFFTMDSADKSSIQSGRVTCWNEKPPLAPFFE